MSTFYLRTESIKTEDIKNLSVVSNQDKEIIKNLLLPDPCLLEGSRGTGKSFLLKLTEIEVDENHPKSMCVYMSFNISSLVTTEDPLQFYHWMLAKTLKSLLNTLRKKGISINSNSASLLSNDENEKEEDISNNLKDIIKVYENSYKGRSSISIDSLPDIEDVKEAIEIICKENDLERIYFLFDEAAHVFRPEQQRQFFSLFKDLRSPYITCNAAIYPGVTYFGNSFEPLHDCIYLKLERDIRDSNYNQYFRDIVFKQSDDSLKKLIETQESSFITLALSSGGNPRFLLNTLRDIQTFNSKNLEQTIKDFYRTKIWSEHTDLGDKYFGHKVLIDWGRDFLEKNVIPAIVKYNETRITNNKNESTIYFWIHKDSPETVKESLRFLTYTGIIRKVDSGIRATKAELGDRYEVKYGCILSLDAKPLNISKDFFNNLTITKFPEFGKNSPAYSSIVDLVEVIKDDEATFQRSISYILLKPISVLQLLTNWQKSKLSEVGINTISDLHNKTEAELIEQIYNVGPYRARIMKSAVDAELLEYISG
ncbi:hypothetical protein SAMN04488062_10278 [Flavobacterium omnivorum]|uniref:RNA polymerase alpha subunit C-terminal domain-containing protein n=1 Tax=Flavobacterium omnivorum TaxID=178355 RepID=A0A1G7WXS9_9FLAO|nr:hypothetical protein [Flavobacterium omnivorum]SDG76757.1 hypothetical protein SAMN04488062_10278 [Flavobacterium omnivorum]